MKPIQLHPEMAFKEEVELSFREPLPVIEEVFYRNAGYSFARCPRCRTTLAREYVQFCDCCGQRLDWSFKRLFTQLV